MHRRKAGRLNFVDEPLGALIAPETTVTHLICCSPICQNSETHMEIPLKYFIACRFQELEDPKNVSKSRINHRNSYISVFRNI